MSITKKKRERYDERRGILSAALPCAVPTRDQVRQLALGAQPDDVLDAAIAAVTAHPICQGMAERLPREPEFDARGLRMEMVYWRRFVPDAVADRALFLNSGRLERS
jgi:predicted RNase H-like nuclease